MEVVIIITNVFKKKKNIYIYKLTMYERITMYEMK